MSPVTPIAATSIGLGALLERSGIRTPGTWVASLAVLCLIPIPGLGTLLGVGIALIAWKVLLAQPLTAPRVVDRAMIDARTQQRFHFFTRRMQRVVRGLLKPRGLGLSGPGARIPLALTILGMAILIALPIPFGNYLPALALLALGAGWQARDGVALCVGYVLAALATGTAAVLLGGLWHVGRRVLSTVESL